nr:cupin domain-containing protein [Streptomyces chartreusis]
MDTETVASHPSALERMVGATRIDYFVHEVWGKRPYFLEGGGSSHVATALGGRFDKERLLHIARRTAESGYADFRMLAAISRDEITNGGHRKPLKPITSEEIEQALEAGSSLLLENLVDSDLQNFADSLRSSLPHFGTVQIRSTITPLGGQHTPHIDPTCSLFIHCEGVKKFRISPHPVIEFPIDSAILDDKGRLKWNNHNPAEWEQVAGIDESSFLEITMHPGDILYFPAGTVHATESLSENCAGVNLQFVHMDISRLLFPLLRKVLLASPSWRRLPPKLMYSDSLLHEYLAERMMEIGEMSGSVKLDDLGLLGDGR